MPLAFLILLLAVIPACGAEGGGTLPPTGSGNGVPVITDADGNRTVTVKVGREVNLRLRPPPSWDFPSATGPAVDISQVDYFQDPGFAEYVLRGVSPGTVVVSSSGLRQDGGKAVRFEVTIRVER